MTLICCVDDNMGMMFNNRRQSRDIEVTKEIVCLAQDGDLFIDRYSQKLFDDSGFKDYKINGETDSVPPKNSYYFLENQYPSAFEKYADRIILFRWNRTYPADIHFDINLKDSWKISGSKEFAGKSHDKITMEVFER